MVFIIISQREIDLQVTMPILVSQSHLVEVLKIPSFRSLWLAQVISQTALNMLAFVLAVVVYLQTRSNASVSFLYLTIGLPAVFFGVISGIYVDRTNKRILLISSTLLRVFLVLLLLFTKSHVGLILGLTFIISLVSQVFIPAEAALIPQFVPASHLMSANALFTVTFYSAIIGGYIVGGPLLGVIGETRIFLLIMLLFGIAAFCLFFLPHEDTQRDAIPRRSWGTEMQEAIRFITQSPNLWQALFLLTVAQAVIAIFVTLGPGFADQILAVRLTDASLIILAPAALGMMVGTGLLGTIGHRFRKRTLINGGILLSGGLLLFVSLLVRTQHGTVRLLVEQIFTEGFIAGILPLSMVSFFLLGFANSLIDISCNTVLQERTTQHLRGRIYGILSSLIAGVAVIPAVVSGILADLLGIDKIIFFLGLLLIIFGIYTTTLDNHSRKA